MLFIEADHNAGGPPNPMILTCPACNTKYVVKDGAIPPGGRQVRCASCKHSWHQDPDGAATDPAPVEAPPTETMHIGEQVAAEPVGQSAAFAGDTAEGVDAPSPPAAPPPVDEGQWQPVEPSVGWDGPAAEPVDASGTEDFEPFYDHEPIDQPKRKWPLLLLLVLLVALAAIAFWFLAPAELRARVGLASAGASQLDVVLLNSNTQRLASGNNLFTVSGRIVNPTDDRQSVPPLHAELLDASKSHVIYSWTISPPTSSLEPNKSASFNSAEVDVPEGGKHLRVRVGGPA
jgi:predicted Zn finger-like uncharacterized protein